MLDFTKFYVDNFFRVYSLSYLGKLITSLQSFFEEANQQQYHNSDFYFDITDKLADIGFQEEALKYYNMGLEQDLDGYLRIIYMTNIGSGYQYNLS